MISENLNEMVKVHNQDPKVVASKIESTDSKTSEDKEVKPEEITIGLTNFYDWYEKYSDLIQNVAHVKAEVSNIDTKDSMIFKIPKPTDNEMMELVSFYKPATRPILNLPPVRVKVFKNDTFEVLHCYNDDIFIKSYGVKAGLYIVFCANIDGRVVPYKLIKVKKNVTTVELAGGPETIKEIKDRLSEDVDSEAIELLYRQASKVKDEFTTKEKTLDWFIKRQQEVVDINHLLKIDKVLIAVI